MQAETLSSVVVVETEMGFDTRERNPFEGASIELFLGV